MRDNVKLLTEIKTWLAIQFKMKDLRNANYVLGIQILRDRKNKMLAVTTRDTTFLTQVVYNIFFFTYTNLIKYLRNN